MADRERAVRALAEAWEIAHNEPVAPMAALLAALDANPEAKAALAAYLAPDTAPSELRAALERAMGTLTDDQIMYDHPASMNGPMDPVLFVEWDAFLRAALRGQPETPGGTG